MRVNVQTAVSSKGKLSKLGEFHAASGAVSDDHGRMWVCAPDFGSLLVFDDTFQAKTE